MKNTRQKSRLPLPPFQSGQVWRMEDSSLEIGLVGKTLVHYKHYKGQMKRSPVSLSAKFTLEKYLNDNHAVLTEK